MVILTVIQATGKESSAVPPMTASHETNGDPLAMANSANCTKIPAGTAIYTRALNRSLNAPVASNSSACRAISMSRPSRRSGQRNPRSVNFRSVMPKFTHRTRAIHAMNSPKAGSSATTSMTSTRNPMVGTNMKSRTRRRIDAGIGRGARA